MGDTKHPFQEAKTLRRVNMSAGGRNIWTSRGELASGGRQMVNLSKVEVVAVVKAGEKVLEVEKASLVAGDLDEACLWDRGERKVERSMLYNLRFERA